MPKILYLVGPTATGKTKIALELAAKFSGEIICADSRQVFVGMTIGSGKDIPKEAVKKMSKLKVGKSKVFYYQTIKTKIWGMDLVGPKDDFSVAVFKRFIDPILADIHKRGKLPIVVGGTGFYANSIETPPESLSIPINSSLRGLLKTFSVTQLQEKLKKLNLIEFKKLNHSDSLNSRRLIRKIEIESAKKNQNITQAKTLSPHQSLWIGLNLPIDKIDQNIEQRVKDRLASGFENECQTLFNKGMLNPDLKSATATGYRQWLEYKQNKQTKAEYIKKWITAEKQYARRQKVWFKNQSNCIWFDVEDPNILNAVVQKVKNW